MWENDRSRRKMEERKRQIQKRNHRIGDFDSSCSGTFLSFSFTGTPVEKNDIPEGRDGCMEAV